MQERHRNKELYLKEQFYTTKKWIIPYITSVKDILTTSNILEIGCGEGGNLFPFLEIVKDGTLLGVDLNKDKVEYGQTYIQKELKEHSNISLECKDVFALLKERAIKFDIIILKDVIEHLPNKDSFFTLLKESLAPNGVIFFSFPPWRMPFGGHQQVCRSKFLSKAIYIHLLPTRLYKSILVHQKENTELISELTSLRETGLSIKEYFKLIKKHNFSRVKDTHYFINPNYEIKFKMRPLKVLPIFKLWFFKDFYTTAIYSIIKDSNN